MPRRTAWLVFALICLAQLPLSVTAATRSWLAPAFGGDRRWSVGANWGGTAPVNGDSLIFNDRSDTTFQDECTNNLSNLQLGSILFNGTHDGTVPDLFGNGITLSGGLSESVSFWGAFVGTPVTLSASQTFESLIDGHLDVTNVNVGVHTLTLETRLGSSRIAIAGRLSGSGRIEVRGPGTVAFDATQTNTFTGVVQVRDGGNLTLRSDLGGVGVPSIVGDLIVGNGSTRGSVDVVNDNQIDGEVVLNSGSDLTLLSFDTFPSLTLIDASVLVVSDKSLGLGGPLTAGGTTNSTIRGPISLGSASRNVVVSNGVELRLAGPISGVNISLTRPGIIKGGDGTLLLLSNNTFAGNVSINAGRVIAAEPLSLGTPTSDVIIISGATAVAQGGELLLSAVSITNELLTLATITGGLSSTGACTWAGTISLTTNAPFNVSNSTLTVSGPVSGAGGIVKRGAGTLALTGTSDNTFTGLTRHEAGLVLLNKTAGLTSLAGNLQIGDAAGGANADIVRIQQADQIADDAVVTLSSSGQLDLNAAETIGTLLGGGTVRLDGGDLTFGGSGTDATLSASILGTFGLTKIGAGIQTLSGANTFTGTTRVLAGTLRINGTQTNSAVQVLGATLEGTGEVGPITSNGKIAPGSGGTGILTSSNLTFQAGGSFAVELGGLTPGTQFDQLVVRGSVQLANATLQPTLSSGYLPASGHSFVILSNDGADAIGGTFSGLPQNAFVSLGNGRRFQIRYNGGDGNDVTLTFTNESVVVKSTTFSLGNGNGRLDPNECGLLGGAISNQTGQALANVSVEYRPLSAGLTIADPFITLPLVQPGVLTSLAPLSALSVDSTVPCGSSVSLAVVLRQNDMFISASTVSLLVGSGGAAGCTDGGGVCTHCPDLVIHGTLRVGDSVQTGTLAEHAQASICGNAAACPGITPTGARRVDTLTFQNGPRTACLTVQLENLCDTSSELFSAAYSGSFNPANLCSRFLADIGTAVGNGKTAEFSFQARADEVFVITVNEYKTGETCGDYRLTVRGGDCRPRLAIQTQPNPNVARVSWPNSAAAWRPQSSSPLNTWNDLAVTPTNSASRFYFDYTSGSSTSRFFRLRKP